MLQAVPVYRLVEKPIFPPAWHAEPNGLLALGGDLTVDRLLAAYQHGIFPWYSQGEPLLWFSPDPRMVLVTRELRMPRGVRRTLEDAPYEVRLDTAFSRVVAGCASVARPGQHGTWITPELQRAYQRLHEMGLAHSAEAWAEGELVGGVYGIGLGGYFSAESMFRTKSGASLLSLVTLVRQLASWGITLFDCQIYSRHTERLGARPWPRRQFLTELHRVLQLPTRRGRWRLEMTSRL
jgi:leucyl/phenylalanyl-tRNA--protein transferase